MKAIGPERLQEIELPDPEPGEGEVRIRVHAAAVNPTDTLLRAGVHAWRLGDRKPPFVPGMDAAGVLDAVGPGVDGRLAVGQPVIALVVPMGPHGGAYAERIVVPAASVVPAPSGTDLPSASTLLMNALTARLAKADGLRVIADAKPADEALVRELGADEVVARGDGVTERIRSLAPAGVPGLVDAAVLDEAAFPAIADGGGPATIRGWRGPAERGIQVHPVLVSERATDTDALDRLRRQVEEGVLTLRVADVLPAARAGEAHRRLAEGGARGRLVLDFS